MPWTPERVELWLKVAAQTLERLPDKEFRYLRNSLRSSFPEVVETSASAWARAVEAYQTDGKAPETRVYKAGPTGREVDQMEAALLGLPKRYLGNTGTHAWLKWLGEDARGKQRQRVLWWRLTGMPWRNIAGRVRRSERTCRRWYLDAIQVIADELTTLDDG